MNVEKSVLLMLVWLKRRTGVMVAFPEIIPCTQLFRYEEASFPKQTDKAKSCWCQPQRTLIQAEAEASFFTKHHEATSSPEATQPKA